MNSLRALLLPLLLALALPGVEPSAQAGALRLDLGPAWKARQVADGTLAAWHGPDGSGLAVVRRLADQLPTTDREAWIARQRASLAELATDLDLLGDEAITRGGVTWQRLHYRFTLGDERLEQLSLLALVVREGVHQGWVVSASWPANGPIPEAVTTALSSLRFSDD